MSTPLGCWALDQLIPNSEIIFFLNQTVIEETYQALSKTNAKIRVKRESVTPITLGVTALAASLTGLTYGVDSTHLPVSNITTTVGDIA